MTGLDQDQPFLRFTVVAETGESPLHQPLEDLPATVDTYWMMSQ
jgi:hypothetical protein